MADDRPVPPGAGSGQVRGRLLGLEDETPLAGYMIEAYDQDLVVDDPLGRAYADAQGKFEIRFDESAYKDFARLDLEGEPEVRLHIVNANGQEVGSVGIVRSRAADFGDLFISAAGEVIAPVLDPEAAAICPRCGILYRSGFTTCSDCQVALRPLSRSSA